jgi:AraC-like DNA-binding protein
LDILNEMLASLRLSGGLFLDGEFSAPWSVLSHISPDDCARFFPIPQHVIAYHFVRSGRLSCRVGDGDPMPVKAGEIVLLPRNEPHFLDGPVPTKSVDARTLLGPAGSDGLFHVRWGGGGALTTVYCGYLGTTEAEHILLQSLPSIMTVGVSQLPDDWVKRTLDFAAGRLSHDSPEMVGKLAEGLFAEAVRRYVAAMPAEEMGWLAGLRDPAVGKALALIHHRYAEPWTLDLLAREAGASKTVLVDRFRALVGESPMQYCADWRMRVATQMLRSNRHNASSVAYSVGFNSEAAFNRAFKREYGVPPATWRRENVH